MQFAAAERAAQVFPAGIGRHGEEFDTAPATAEAASAQLLAMSQDTLQRGAIGPNSGLGAVELAAIWRNLEEMPDRDRPKAKLSGKLAEYCTPSFTSRAPARRA